MYKIIEDDGSFCFKKYIWTKEQKEKRSKLQQGKNNSNYKGGKKKDGKGYLHILMPNHPFCDHQRYILESHFIVEKQIGRYLKPEEICHHINEIKDDNRPENLMAFINRSIHYRFHGNPANVKPEEIVFDGRKLKSSVLI